jgi:Flp pilus assembly protein TadD
LHPGLAERIRTAIALLPSQLSFLVPGLPLGPDFRIEPARSWTDPRVGLGLLLNGAAVFAIVRRDSGRGRVAAATALLWLPLALIAGLTLTRGALLNGSRNLYLPSAGAAWLLGVGADALWRRGLAPTTLPRWLVPAGFVALMIACGDLALIQMSGWRTDETMYLAMIRVQPRNPDGYLGLALVDIGFRRDARALEALRRASVLDSTRYQIGTYHAAIASRQRNWPEVVRWAKIAQARGATEADSWLMEVAAYQSMNMLPQASLVLDTLMARNKSDPDVAAAFGQQMLLENRPNRAVKPLQYAVSWNPQDASLALRLGDAYARVGQLAAAKDEFKRASGLEPANVDAWLRLASVCHLLMDLGGRDEALRNAASLPGTNPAMIDSLWRKMAGVGEE